MTNNTVRAALPRLSSPPRPSGENTLDSLANDLPLVPTLEQGWQRLCAAAWLLGFSCLRLDPEPPFATQIPPRGDSCGLPGGYYAAAAPSWTFELRLRETHAATLRATLGPAMQQFNAGRLAECVQALLSRFVASSGPEPASDR